MKTEFFRQIFEKYSDIESHYIQWQPSCFLRTDRHDETNSRSS